MNDNAQQTDQPERPAQDLEDHCRHLENLTWTLRIVSWAIEDQYRLGGYSDALLGVAQALEDRAAKLDEYGASLSPSRDPIFALIEAHQQAAMAVLAECGKTTDVPIAVSVARDEAEKKLFATKPTTLEGMRALMAHINHWWENFYGDTSEPLEPLFLTFARTDAERRAGVP